jgi:hypothetical protein
VLNRSEGLHPKPPYKISNITIVLKQGKIIQVISNGLEKRVSAIGGFTLRFNKDSSKNYRKTNTYRKIPEYSNSLLFI